MISLKGNKWFMLLCLMSIGWMLKIVECKVGVKDKHGFAVNLIMRFTEYSCEYGLITVGGPRNLVVNQQIGKKLCRFLIRKNEEFNKDKLKWLQRHNKFTNSISWLNFFRKLYNKFLRHPEFEIHAKVTYIHLLDSDDAGNPIPWCIANFFYKQPVKGKNAYDLFKLSENFSGDVVLLLSPSFDVNRGKKSSLLAAVPSLIDLAATPEINRLSYLEREPVHEEDTTGVLLTYVDSAISLFSLKIHLADIWKYGFKCYLLDGRFYTYEDRNIFSNHTLCEWADSIKLKSTSEIVMSEFLKAVTINVGYIEIFALSRVKFCGKINEGILTKRQYRGRGCFYLNTDPSMKQKHDMAAAANFIKNVAVATHHSGLFSKSDPTAPRYYFSSNE